MRTAALLRPLAIVAGIAAFAASECPVVSLRTAAAATGVFAQNTDDLDPQSLAVAAERTANALDAQMETGPFVLGHTRVTTSDLAASARIVAKVARSARDPRDLTARLAQECTAYRFRSAAKITGYYEPVLAARRARDARFLYPIYREPPAPDLAAVTQRLGHAPLREDIDRGGALAGLGLEIAWLDDPVERFLLHVQGSGRLVFDDGTSERIGFAATNDAAYRSIGSVMLKKGMLARGHASADEIREWLRAHPDRRDAILFENPRYVFFRETGQEGPVGSLGVSLVGGRSIASDDRYVPRGILAWLVTTATAPGSTPVARFVFAQDAGAAISGPARVDLFEGSGEQAGTAAGKRNDSGELYMLVCREDGRQE
ncbi:MAG TPA: MltA domain-containing protein [Candidatus Limnocylindrales bacterium]|nr:MltA domain-containing protein [Candidatus Limnocylindrales bacterium]